MTQSRTQRVQTSIVVAAVALSGFTLGAIAIGNIMDELGGYILIVGLCSALLGSAAVALALKLARTRRTAAGLAIGFTMVAAMLNSPISFVSVSLLGADGYESIGLVEGAFFALLVGLAFTIPLGLVFSALYASLAYAVHRSTRDEAHEALEVTVRAVGIWLAMTGSFAAVFALPLFALRRIGVDLATAMLLLAVGQALLGVVAASIAAALISRRRRWFQSVLFGSVPGFAIVADARAVAPSAEVRPLFVADEPPAGLLVRRRAGVAAGAYRTGEQLEPVARV